MPIDFSLDSVLRDIMVAEKCISDRFLAGSVAYHLQQATEKILKIEIASREEDFRLYTHDITTLCDYSANKKYDFYIPDFVLLNSGIITSWEAKSRYNDSFEVEEDELSSCLKVIKEWYVIVAGRES